MSHDRAEVIKNFTRGRKFPQLIGRTPDGRKILGGPYTLPQVVGGGVAALILWVTRALWLGGLVWNVGFFLAVVLGTVFAMGRLRLGGRSPASVLQGVARAVVVPRTARIDGHPVRSRRAHLLRAGGRVHPVAGTGVELRTRVETPCTGGPDLSTSMPQGTERHTTIPAAARCPGETCKPGPDPAGNGRPPLRARSSVKELLALAGRVG